MPIYEFKCNDCGCQFETLQMRKDEKITCGKCGSGKLDKLVSSFAVHGAESRALSSSGSGCKCGPGCTNKCSTCSH